MASPDSSASRDRSKHQTGRCFVHPNLPQDASQRKFTLPFRFVVAADTQLGILSQNESWDVELEYSRRAVSFLNRMDPPPAFVSICGDLVDMEPSIHQNEQRSERLCTAIQMKQYHDFKRIWYQELNQDVPLICLCGNHDVGNTPTAESIERFTTQFGDDYFAFWCKGCYFINLNTNLFSDPSKAMSQFTDQNQWLVQVLKQARENKAKHVFIFGHHPFFLFQEDEPDDLPGTNKILYPGLETVSIPDGYFHIPRERRDPFLALCKEFHVTAVFAGHYHQNLVATTSWGMQHVVTGALSVMLESNAKPKTNENATPGPGVRVCDVDQDGLRHTYELI